MMRLQSLDRELRDELGTNKNDVDVAHQEHREALLADIQAMEHKLKADTTGDSHKADLLKMLEASEAKLHDKISGVSDQHDAMHSDLHSRLGDNVGSAGLLEVERKLDLEVARLKAEQSANQSQAVDALMQEINIVDQAVKQQMTTECKRMWEMITRNNTQHQQDALGTPRNRAIGANDVSTTSLLDVESRVENFNTEVKRLWEAMDTHTHEFAQHRARVFHPPVGAPVVAAPPMEPIQRPLSIQIPPPRELSSSPMLTPVTTSVSAVPGGSVTLTPLPQGGSVRVRASPSMPSVPMVAAPTGSAVIRRMSPTLASPRVAARSWSEKTIGSPVTITPPVIAVTATNDLEDLTCGPAKYTGLR